MRRKTMADEYISKAELYKQIAEKEELARNRYLDTPSTLPVPIFVNPSYERYTAQLNERTAFKHMVADFPPADVVQVCRCRNCKYFYEDIGICDNTDALVSPTADGFCSYGERKE
jgi:hypothetical protein